MCRRTTPCGEGCFLPERPAHGDDGVDKPVPVPALAVCADIIGEHRPGAVFLFGEIRPLGREIAQRIDVEDVEALGLEHMEGAHLGIVARGVHRQRRGAAGDPVPLAVKLPPERGAEFHIAAGAHIVAAHFKTEAAAAEYLRLKSVRSAWAKSPSVQASSSEGEG